MDIEAKNKTQAINKARELRNAGEGFSGCNNFFFIWWDPPTSSSLILNLWVGPAHKLFSNRDKMSHDPRTVMRQSVY
jgi:hypothetical protein